MHYFTFILPAKTHIKKYITSLYGDPIRVDLKTDIGFVVLNTLASRLECKLSRGYIDLWQNRFNDKIIFKVPFHYFSITKKEVSPFTFVLLNRYFENQFEKEFNSYVHKSKNQEGKTIKQSIENFLDTYGIDLDIDISFEAIKKSEYRYRKTLSKEISRTLSPSQNIATRA